MIAPGPFHDPAAFPFVARLEAMFAAVRDDYLGLAAGEMVESPDSLSAVDGVYDERGWRWYSLAGVGTPAELEAHCARCPAAAAACDAVPGLVNAGFSKLLPGTHLYPHQGELRHVLRCHLPLVVPDGDAAIAFGDDVRRWQPGRCLVFDDTFEHTAWNHAASERVVLLLTFRVG